MQRCNALERNALQSRIPAKKPFAKALMMVIYGEFYFGKPWIMSVEVRIYLMIKSLNKVIMK